MDGSGFRFRHRRTIIEGMVESVKANVREADTTSDLSARARILKAALTVFSDKGYDGASTRDIAAEAKVSKRDLYTNFGSKHDILSACIEARAAKMQLAAELPPATSRAMLETVLGTFATRILKEVTNPKIVSVFRLAIAEATRSPEIARTLDKVGREATSRALIRFMANAQDEGLVVTGDPVQFATEFMALAWEGSWATVMLGVTPSPSKKAIDAQVQRAIQSFLALRGKSRARS